MTGSLDRTGFMGCNMSKVGTDSGFPRTEKCGNSGLVSLGTADEEMDIGIGATEHSADFISGVEAIFILTISGCSLKVCFGQRVEHLREAAFGVIVFQVNHRKIPFLFL